MADRVNQTASSSSVHPSLLPLAVPAGAAAIQWTVACANQALLRCLPERFRTRATSDRFITPARIVSLPQHELMAREQADKPATSIQAFRFLLTAGLSREHANQLTYSVNADTNVYANIFLEQPTFFVDEQLYRQFFVSDPNERQQAACLFGHAVIVINLAAAPRARVLPQQRWQAVIQHFLEQDFLPVIRRRLWEIQAYDEHRFATATSQLLALLPADAMLPATDHALRERINTLVNAVLGDDQPVDAVDWEPETASRFVAHGAKVFFLRAGQQLPVFEFGTGLQLDAATQQTVVHQALLAFYARLQEYGQLPIVANHHQELLQQAPAVPRVYHELGLSPRSIVEHYLQSDLPAWYLEQQQRPWRRKSAPATEFALYPP